MDSFGQQTRPSYCRNKCFCKVGRKSVKSCEVKMIKTLTILKICRLKENVQRVLTF